MMNCRLVCLVVIGLAYSVVPAISEPVAPGSEDEVKQLSAIVYAKEGNPISFNETVEAIQRLVAILKLQSTDLQAKYDRDLARRLNRYFKRRFDHCQITAYTGPANAVEEFAEYVNLKPYFQELLRQRFRFCRDRTRKFAEDAALDELGLKKSKDVLMLKDCILSAPHSSFDKHQPGKLMSKEDLTGGMAIFQSKYNWPADIKDNVDKVSVRSHRYISRLCTLVNKFMEVEWVIYNRMATDSTLIDEMTEEEIAWPIVSKLCHDLAKNKLILRINSDRQVLEAAKDDDDDDE